MHAQPKALANGAKVQIKPIGTSKKQGGGPSGAGTVKVKAAGAAGAGAATAAGAAGERGAAQPQREKKVRPARPKATNA